ncbi:DUF1854 domain-containing protein [Kamptonema cortianum]|nr:DUF1854 domain-containing protein [Geitlerinema splendidum]MDK3162499.1 DUF1854 domain-containing protein [Kamptonema cortianum]
MKLFYEPVGRLRLTLEDRSYVEVTPVWASPLSYPDQYMAFIDGKGKEIALFKNPEAELPPDVWDLAKKELRQRYLNGTIHKVLETKTEYGSTYWTVITDRGRREFVTQSLNENAQWLKPNYLLIIDVDGNRFEIPDINALDEQSRKWLHTTV